MNEDDKMHTADDFVPKPWYRQFWPWFLISIPAATIVASIITINLAVTTADGLVSENYYKEGLAIHLDADALLLARQQGIQADVSVSSDRRLLELTLTSEGNRAYGEIKVDLRHPTRAHHDVSLSMQPVGPNRYQAQLPANLVPARWKIEVSAPESGWQLHGRMDIQKQQQVVLR
jgi:hypothetical protein